jgi:hypothetical protein
MSTMTQPVEGARGRGGRPRKPGRRERIDVWFPAALKELVRNDAAERHITMGDRIAEILVAHYAATRSEGVLRRSA